MESIDIAPTDSELTVEVSVERLEAELCEQGILGKNVDNYDFAYLAAIALGTWDDKQYDIYATLMEFIRNSSKFDNLSYEDCEEIEAILRQ